MLDCNRALKVVRSLVIQAKQQCTYTAVYMGYVQEGRGQKTEKHKITRVT